MWRPYFLQLLSFSFLCLLHIQCGFPNRIPPTDDYEDDYYEDDYTPSESSKFGHIDNTYLKTVLQELEQGNKKNIDSKDEDGNAPIHLTFKESGCEMKESLKFLLQHGADVNAVDEEGNTPLILAAKMESEDTQKQVIRSLLKQDKPNRNIQNDDGDTALMTALKQRGNSDYIFSLVKKLADEQTDFTLKDAEGNLPLHLAMHIYNAGQRKKVWRHIVEHMKKTIKRGSISLQVFINEDGKNPYELLDQRSSAGHKEKADFWKAYSELTALAI